MNEEMCILYMKEEMCMRKRRCLQERGDVYKKEEMFTRKRRCVKKEEMC